ncbi:MAG: hypothetical protein AAGA54_37020, partial [Myxococcota bacterium]
PTSSDAPSSRTVDNSEGGLMALHVERIGPRIYSLAHYFKQNGDMMRDPDVVLFQDTQGRWFPVTFQQDGGIPVYTVALELNGERITGVYRRRYRSLRDFVRLWLRNLRVQQGIR